MTALESNLKLYLLGCFRRPRLFDDDFEHFLTTLYDLSFFLEKLMEREKITGYIAREKLIRSALRLFQRAADWRYIDKAKPRNAHLLPIVTCALRMIGLARGFECLPPVVLPPIIRRQHTH